ncbi:MAG: SprT-like domain-containing protein [Candidatus Macondimonas sp.]
MSPYAQAQQWLAAQPDWVADISRRATELDCQAAGRVGLTPCPPQLAFDLRGTRAGCASADGRIRLNPVLLRENPADFLAQTLPHEVAHWVVFLWRPGAAPHGPEWREVMNWLDAPARRCHGFDVGRARVRILRRHPYACACRAHEVSAILHRRIQGGAAYRCRACGSVLRPQGEAGAGGD